MNNDPKEPRLLEHEVDGIKELDNLLPRWWVWLFYLSFFFAVGYMVYFHVLRLGDLSAAEYRKEMQAGDALKAATMTKFEAGIPNLAPSKDQTVLATGRQLFLTRCAPCHRPDGGGLVGPNLCDDYWIHGSNFADNVTTIWNGVPAKGMITWKNYMNPKEIYTVASYIYTLRGTHPPNPKPPENTVQVPTGPSQFE